MVALKLQDCLNKIDELGIQELASYSYSERSMVKVFAYGLIKGIREFKALHDHLEGKPEVRNWLKWQQVPHRTTLSRRFKGLPEKLCSLIAEVYQKFVITEQIEEMVMSVDSSLMRAQGNVWHKKDRDAGVLPSCGNIDTEAHWGVDGCGEWTYGYRVHCLVNADAELALPKDIAVHAANLKDGAVFTDELALSLSGNTEVVLADWT